MVKRTDRKIKITFLVDFFRTINAGTENQLSHLLSELPSSGFSVQLISLQDSPFLKNEAQKLFPDVEIISLGAQSDISRSIGSLIRLFFLLFKRRPTIVHTFFPTSNSIGIIIAFFTSNRSLFSSRRDLGYNLSKKDIFLLRMANLFVSSIIVNAKAVKTRTVEIEKVIPEKIKVIYNGIALKNNIKKQNLSMEEINVGIVANLNRTVKRIDVFINAAVTVVRSYPQVKFKIIGDGHLRNSLEQQVDTLDLNSRIEFLGRRKDVDNLLASINIGVLCSDSEGLSNTIMEYMLAGLPVVATKVGGNIELVEHGRTGYLVPPGDAETLAEKIIECLDNPSLSLKFGKAGREKIMNTFSKEIMLKKTSNLYKKELYKISL